MLIRCPECRFERQIDENAIPANAAMATCPHCQYRFRFRNPDGTPVADETPAAAPAPQTAPAGRPLPPDLDGDDPLPPGAMVPRIPGDHDASAPTPEVPEAEPQKGQPAPPQNVAEKRSDFWNNFQKKRDGESKGKGGIAAAMHVDGTDVPWEEPKRYNLFMALYQTLVERMWYLMSIQASGPSITDPKLQEVLGDVAQSMSLPLTILLTPGILAIQLCFFASVFYLMLRLVQPENVQFRTVFRVIAYSAAPTVVCIVPLVGPLVGSIWFGVCCFIGCKYSMRLPWSRTGLALGPLYLIAFAIGMQLIRQFLSMSA